MRLSSDTWFYAKEAYRMQQRNRELLDVINMNINLLCRNQGLKPQTVELESFKKMADDLAKDITEITKVAEAEARSLNSQLVTGIAIGVATTSSLFYIANVLQEAPASTSDSPSPRP